METTRGTPPPQGHGATVVVLVVLMVCGAVALSTLVNFRVAAYALAGVLLVVAAARALLPMRLVGSIAVRSRGLDALTAAVMAVALVMLAGGVPL